MERCIPTARAMPSSFLRSAASITKIRKIKQHPRRHRELPEEDEQGREDLALLVGPVYGILLHRIGVRVRWTKGGALSSSTVASVYLPPSTAGPPCVTSTSLTLPPSPTSFCSSSSGITIEVSEAGLAPLS